MRGRRSIRVVTVGACTLLSLIGCDGRSRAVFAAFGDTTSTRLELNIDSCNENPTAEIDESDTEVRVRVTSGRWLGRNADDCADGIVVNLEEPLGTRIVVDRSTGTVVQVLPADEDLPPR